jgi:DGQHR domain-containing protein
MNIEIPVISFEQPIGTLYFGKLNASILVEIAETHRRIYEDYEPKGGEQRDLSRKRAKDIAEYCKDPDATFPTPIILALGNEHYSLHDDVICTLKLDSKFRYKILDGQHRIEGIKLAGEKYYKNFELPIVFVVNPTEEECAYIFSIINSKQTRVSPSLIYDLFEVSSQRSPQKSCHDIARALNSDKNSPFYNRLKMLGKGGGVLASISQASFIKFLLENITSKPNRALRAIKQGNSIEVEDLPFNKYFREEKDEVILKILENLFSAVSKVFHDEWNDPKSFILSKAIGYGAILKAFPVIYSTGVELATLDENYFIRYMQGVKEQMKTKELAFTSDYFSSNEASRKKLAIEIAAVAENIK